MTNLTLVSPLSGWVSPLDEVPDPVFSERILGDGLAIDPTAATMHAPCDGIVISAARHAVTLRAGNGAEILIHVGLETVALHGQGFVTHVREGAGVRTGDPLITFDLDFLASNAKSLISPVVVTNGERFSIVRRSADRETALGEFLMELKPLAEETQASGAAEVATREVTVLLAHGIHARPAAVISTAAKRFAADIELHLGDRRVNAKSIAALMSLGVAKGDRVTILASGSDAESIAASLASLIAHGIEEKPDLSAAAPPRRAPPASLPPSALSGVCGAPGLAIGRALQFRAAAFEIVEAGQGVAHESGMLAEALRSVKARIERLADAGNRQRREILGAHLALLDDPELIGEARRAIGEGKSAAFAWRQAIQSYAQAFRTVDDARLRERVGDLVDLERQVMAALHGEAAALPQSIAPDTILIAAELLPSEIASLGGIGGLVLADGGPTSHVSILAAGMGLPALVSVGEAALAIADGTMLVVDSEAGLLHMAPDEESLTRVRLELETRKVQETRARSHAREECRMADSTPIAVLANLGAGKVEAQRAVEAGAEGCGLLRTEFLFLDRETAPTEEEQRAAYQEIADALDGRPLKIRTFDVGGDKPVPYLSLPAEDNPALGLRGVRAGLWRKDLLETQLAAILRVTPLPKIMLPMVASLSELRAVRAMLDALQSRLGLRERVQLGVMVETPASAVLADQLAREADFFSIGTNDLTQYTLAMDRGHAGLAPQIDAFHPAVLSLVATAAAGAAKAGKQVAVCGGLAGDPLAAALLIGMGIVELSVAPSAIARLKETIRRLQMSACRAAVAEALIQDSAQAVRTVAAKYLPVENAP